MTSERTDGGDYYKAYARFDECIEISQINNQDEITRFHICSLDEFILILLDLK